MRSSTGTSLYVKAVRSIRSSGSPRLTPRTPAARASARVACTRSSMRMTIRDRNDRECRLQLILLEEHPLEQLSSRVTILGNETRSVPEVPEDRSGLCEWPTVVEYEGWHAKCRVELAEQFSPIRAVDDVHCLALVRDPEVCEQKNRPIEIARASTRTSRLLRSIRLSTLKNFLIQRSPQDAVSEGHDIMRLR